MTRYELWQLTEVRVGKKNICVAAPAVTGINFGNLFSRQELSCLEKVVNVAKSRQMVRNCSVMIKLSR